MITNFKIFENKENKPKFGDYVKINPIQFGKNMYDFFNDNFGQVIKVTADPDYPYSVKFNVNFPSADYNNLTFSDSEIEEYASTVDDLKIKLQAKKYNL